MQELVVAFLVASAAGYSVWRFAPAALRRGAARGVARLAQRAGASKPTARRIEIRMANPSGGCGDCAASKTCSARAAESPVADSSCDAPRDPPRP